MTHHFVISESFKLRIFITCFLSVITLFAGSVYAEEKNHQVNKSFYLLDSSQHIIVEDDGHLHVESGDEGRDVQQSAVDIREILYRHYVGEEDTRSLMEESITSLAEYISQFPQAVTILKSVDNKPWSLKYREKSFVTEVTGTRFKVESATILFDPLSAAKLKFHRACEKKPMHCIASPADAFLHELLHIRSIFLDTEEFLAQGGMSRTIYPYMYEQKIIDQENSLYKSMSRKDKRPRPIRREHFGKYAVASCVTCIH